MDWKEFEASSVEFPEALLESKIRGFNKATKGMLDIRISELTTFSGVQLFSKFEFRAILISSTLEKYMFEIFRFGYDELLYPVRIKIDKDIYEQLQIDDQNIEVLDFLGEQISVDDEETFSKIVEKIFASDRFNEIVSGLMKISQRKRK